uniref:Uncharacterized protein n=1 Tax=Seriola lalandi dorsalis TaxID=1841481 RepID=A0A3B4YW61_SERLL
DGSCRVCAAVLRAEATSCPAASEIPALKVSNIHPLQILSPRFHQPVHDFFHISFRHRNYKVISASPRQALGFTERVTRCGKQPSHGYIKNFITIKNVFYVNTGGPSTNYLC